MAHIISENTNQEKTIPDGSPIKGSCMELGVPFSCEDGICGTCMIDIIEGEENLSNLTPQEIDLMRDKKHRLACQCKIKGGIVKIRF